MSNAQPAGGALVVTSTSKKKSKNKGKNRKNPLGSLLGMLMPLVTGGGIGVMTAKNPTWWANTSNIVKAVILVGISVVAKQRKQPELYGAASAFAAYYLALEGMARWAARDLSGLNRGALPDAGAIMDAADRELEEVVRRVQAMEGTRGGDVGRLVFDKGEIDLGALPNADIMDELDAIIGQAA